MRISAVVLIVLLISFPLWGQRIVSLAPALTEIVVEFGLSDHLVGRTKFCDYPPAVQHVPAVGGLLDLNLEFVYRLQPEFIVCYQEQIGQLKAVQRMAKVMGFKHRLLADLEETIISIGRTFGLQERAKIISSEIQKKLARIRRQAAQLPEKRVLFIVSRERSGFKNMIVAGNNDFLSELLKICGVKNAYEGKIAYPSLSLEAVLAIQPDLLIEFRYQEKSNSPSEEIVAEWRKQFLKFRGQRPQVRVVTNSALLRLGPRIASAGEELLRVIHGE